MIFVSFAIVEWIDVFATNDVDLKFLPHERIRAAAWGNIRKCKYFCKKNNRLVY